MVEEEVIFVDDGAGAVLFLAFLLFFMTAIKQAPHHRHTHTLGLTRSARREEGPEEPGKDLSDGSTAKSCMPAGLTDDLWSLFLRMVK